MTKKDLTILRGETMIPFHPVLAETFDITSALVIQQVHYWCIKTPKLIAGEYWTYNTYEQWAAQLRVVSITSLRRAIKELEDLGVLRVGVFNKKGYDRTRWYRVDYDVLAEKLLEATGAMWSIWTHGSDQDGHMQLSKLDGPIPKTMTKTPSDSHSSLTAADVLAKFGKQGKQAETPAGLMTGKEYEEKKKAPTPALPKKKGDVPEMILLWKKRLSLQSGSFIKDLTGKQRGQLRIVHKALGAEAYDVLDWCLQNWSAFVIAVRHAKGLSTYPSTPDIGFFCMFFDIAANAMVGVPKKTYTPPVSPVKAVAPYPVYKLPSVANTAEDLATEEDIANTMAEIEALQKGVPK